jgi:hypothetical protein
MDVRETADKILSYKSYSDKRKIDSLLELNAIIYTNLGTDSTATEKRTAQADSNYIYNTIKKIDSALGSFLYIHKC